MRYSRTFEPFLQLIERDVEKKAQSTYAELLVHVCRTLTGFSEPGRGRLEEVLNVKITQQMNVKELCACVDVHPSKVILPERKKRWSFWPFS